MSDNDDLAFTSTTELRALIASGEVSPVEVTELYLDRIDRLDSRLNSYLTVSADHAIDSAREAEAAVARGDALGPLHGVPISIKDLELTRGIRTTGGSLAFQDRVPDEDSAVVERVRAAGAVILGKTNTPEFGLLGHTQNLLGDHCRNPWNTERTSGGSSGGAGAAVAAGLCSLATGSDGGGSIRIPSSFCGVYGIKPTQHRVPMYAGAASAGVFNMFSQSGPMTRTVADSAVLLQVMAGPRSAVLPLAARRAGGLSRGHGARRRRAAAGVEPRLRVRRRRPGGRRDHVPRGRRCSRTSAASWETPTSPSTSPSTRSGRSSAASFTAGTRPCWTNTGTS